MRPVLFPLLVLLVGGTGCTLENPNATPEWNGRALADLDSLSVRTVASKVARPFEAALDALLKADCRILHSDPASGIITFTTTRREVMTVRPWDTILEGTLRMHVRPEGLQLNLVLGGRTIWHGTDKDVTETFPRASLALHKEFLDRVEGALR